MEEIEIIDYEKESAPEEEKVLKKEKESVADSDNKELSKHQIAVKEMEKQGFVVDKDFVKSSILIKDEGNDKEFKEITEIAKEYNAKENIYRFSNTKRENVFWDSLLATCGDVPDFADNVKPRYEFIKRFREHYHVNMKSVKAQHSQDFVKMVEGLLGFRGALAWKQAGVRSPDMMGQPNKIKSLF